MYPRVCCLTASSSSENATLTRTFYKKYVICDHLRFAISRIYSLAALNESKGMSDDVLSLLFLPRMYACTLFAIMYTGYCAVRRSVLQIVSYFHPLLRNHFCSSPAVRASYSFYIASQRCRLRCVPLPDNRYPRFFQTCRKPYGALSNVI